MPHSTTDTASVPQVTFREAFWVWCRVACLSFGGPTAQIAVMHRILVDEKRWISEQRFLQALNYCMLLPGPEAQQLATYIGWLLHRGPGGIVAGGLFVLPGAISILLLSLMYAAWQSTPLLEGAFFGIKAAILAVILEAVVRISKKVLHNRVMYGVAAASFLALFLFQTPFPVVILLAALLGIIGEWSGSPQFQVLAKKSAATDTAASQIFPADLQAQAPYYQPDLGRALRTLIVCLALWWGPVIAVGMWWGSDHILLQTSVFFSKAAVVTFGGAYSVLAYISQQAVHELRWLTDLEMADGLGLAETTPGPLIMVVQFVAFMAAFHQPGNMSPWLAAILASLLTTWVTFLPSFLYIFVGAPYVEAVRKQRWLSAALSTITAAVVGVVLNLAITLAMSTLFKAQLSWEIPSLLQDSPVQFRLPDIRQPNWGANLIAVAAAELLLRRHWPLLWMLGLSIPAGLLIDQIQRSV